MIAAYFSSSRTGRALPSGSSAMYEANASSSIKERKEKEPFSPVLNIDALSGASEILKGGTPARRRVEGIVRAGACEFRRGRRRI